MEVEAPWVAKPVRPDLRRRRQGSHVESQQLAEQGAKILGIPRDVTGTPAIPRPDVEHGVGTEHREPAVVVRVGRVRNGGDQCRGRRGDVGVRRRTEPLDGDGTIQIGVVDVEESIARVPRIEGDAQQSLLAAVPHSARDVEEGRRQQLPTFHDANAARLFDDEESGIIGRSREVDRIRQPLHDELKIEREREVRDRYRR